MDTIMMLVKLQENDDIIKENNRILRDGSHIYLLKKLKTEFENSKSRYVEKEDKLKELRQRFIKLSQDINNERRELEHSENELQIQSEISYKIAAHIQNKIESSRAKLKKLEDESVELLEIEEKLSVERESLRVELVNLKENFYKYKEDINREINKAQLELEKAKLAKEDLKKVIPEQVMLKYEKLLENKHSAVAKLEGGMCSSCRMRVSAQTIDKVYKKDNLITCNNCGRFLYYNLEDLKLAK